MAGRYTKEEAPRCRIICLLSDKLRLSPVACTLLPELNTNDPGFIIIFLLTLLEQSEPEEKQ